MTGLAPPACALSPCSGPLTVGKPRLVFNPSTKGKISLPQASRLKTARTICQECTLKDLEESRTYSGFSEKHGFAAAWRVRTAAAQPGVGESRAGGREAGLEGGREAAGALPARAPTGTFPPVASAGGPCPSSAARFAASGAPHATAPQLAARPVGRRPLPSSVPGFRPAMAGAAGGSLPRGGGSLPRAGGAGGLRPRRSRPARPGSGGGGRARRACCGPRRSELAAPEPSVTGQPRPAAAPQPPPFCEGVLGGSVPFVGTTPNLPS